MKDMNEHEPADNPTGVDAVLTDGSTPFLTPGDPTPPTASPPGPSPALSERISPAEAWELTRAIVSRRPKGKAGLLLTDGYQSITPEQLKILLGMGFEDAEWLTKREAAGLIEQQKERIRQLPATEKQQETLVLRGLWREGITRGEASRLLLKGRRAEVQRRASEGGEDGLEGQSEEVDDTLSPVAIQNRAELSWIRRELGNDKLQPGRPLTALLRFDDLDAISAALDRQIDDCLRPRRGLRLSKDLARLHVSLASERGRMVAEELETATGLSTEAAKERQKGKAVCIALAHRTLAADLLDQQGAADAAEEIREAQPGKPLIVVIDKNGKVWISYPHRPGEHPRAGEKRNAEGT
jgi:hypothetical protein